MYIASSDHSTSGDCSDRSSPTGVPQFPFYKSVCESVCMCIQQEGCPSLNNQEPVLVLKLLLFLSSHLCNKLLLYSNVIDCIGKKRTTSPLLECSSVQVEHGLCNWLQWNQFFFL